MSRVLVVDDSASIAEGLRWVLSDEGHEVHVITEGMRGLLDPTHPAWDGLDVLLTDLMMPLVTGVQILQAAKTYAPQAMRIALTAADDGELRKAASDIADLVLPKPTDWTLIVDAVSGRET